MSITDEQAASIHRELGNVSGQLAALNNEMAVHRKEADDRGRDIYSRMNAFHADFNQTTTRLGSVQQQLLSDVREIKQRTEKVEKSIIKLEARDDAEDAQKERSRRWWLFILEWWRWVFLAVGAAFAVIVAWVTFIKNLIRGT